MGITLARETAGGIRSVGWFEETENRLNKDRPTQFWTRLDRMTESVAIAERPSSCCDELRTLVCTYFAIGSRENRVAENGIGPAPVIPEQTGLRNHYYANQIKYQKGRQWLLWPSDVTTIARIKSGIKSAAAPERFRRLYLYVIPPPFTLNADRANISSGKWN